MAALGVSLVLAASVAAVAMASPAAAHFGLGLRPTFTEPVGLVVVDADAPLTFAWTSLEEHPEVDYVFSYQAADLPPTPAVPRAWRDGTPWGSTPADALVKQLDWDLSEVPSGAWRVYAEFEEPPFCLDLELAPALVVVRRAGDPAPLGLLVTEPFDDSVVVEAAATVRLEAIAPAAVTVTIEAGDLVVDPDFPPNTLCTELIWAASRVVARDLPLEADPAGGADRYRLDYAWDTRAVPSGAYLLRVTARDALGSEAVAYARRWINVEREEDEDPGPGADGGPSEPGAEGAEVAEGAEEGGSVGGGCHGGPAAPLAALVAALVLRLALVTRRRFGPFARKRARVSGLAGS